MSDKSRPVDPQVVLESAITSAIREYEKVLPRTVIGVSITRVDRKLLEVGALIIPGKSTGGQRRSKLRVGSIQVTREG